MTQPEPDKDLIFTRSYEDVESEDCDIADEESVHVNEMMESADVGDNTRSSKKVNSKVLELNNDVDEALVRESSNGRNEVKHFGHNADNTSDLDSIEDEDRQIDAIAESQESTDDVTGQIFVRSEKKPNDEPDYINSGKDKPIVDSKRVPNPFQNGNSKVFAKSEDDMLIKEMCTNDYMWKTVKTVASSVAPTLVSSMAEGEGESNHIEAKVFNKWHPPSIPIALEFQRRTLFREGAASLWTTDLASAEDLSEGAALYFEFARSSCVCIFILSILSIPSMIFSYSGSRIPIGDRDILGFYQFTIGNIGYDPMSSTFKVDSTCLHQPESYDGTCINVLGGEVKLADAQTAMSTLEFLQIVIFFLFIFRFSRRRFGIRKHEEEEDCKIGDYSVMCRHLPKDTTVADLRRHFDSLYPLDKPDWAKRPSIARTRVVQKCENSGESSFIGTWVADCVIFSAIGKGLSAFKLHQDWTIDLLRSRAMVNMYSHDTCHSGGPNIVNKLQAEIVMKKVEKKIAKLTEQLDQHKENLIDIHRVSDLEAQEMLSQKLKLTSRADAVAGFVTFEYSECMRRCVEDYGYYNSFPRNLLFYPSKLKLKGQRIKVQRAPDPGEMIWEHLEVSGMSKRLKRVGTALLSLLLLIMSFMAILQASIYKKIFSDRIPSGALCSSTIPALYGAYSNIIDYEDFRIVRPDAGQRFSLDSKCDAVVPGSFYAVYSTAGNISIPVAQYSFQACDSSLATPSYYYQPTGSSEATSTLGGTCPHYGQKVFCPCITKSSLETCHSAACESSSSSSNPACSAFPDTTLSACYCQQLLNSYLKSGVPAALRYLGTLSASSAPDSCSTYFADYSTAQGVSYGTIIASIIVNDIVVFGMKRLCTFESHVSVDRVNASLMFKLFLFTYLNMAFTVLIAFGKIGNLPIMLRKFYIFQGQYSDFSSHWYPTAGVYFLTAFFINAVMDIVLKLGMYYVVIPIMQCYSYPAVRKMSSHRVVTQYELNHMLVGPVFDTSINYAHFLSMFFFAMTYATGLPIMMPLAFAALSIVFFVDRLMLLRFNQKPPQMGDEVMQIVLKLLPFAGIIRLAFGCWMYSSPDIFGVSLSTPILDYYNDWLSSIMSSAVLWFTGSESDGTGPNAPSLAMYALQRVFKPNVFPLLLLLAMAIVAAVVQILWKFLPFFWIEKIASFVSELLWRPCCKSVKVHAVTDDTFLRSCLQSDIRVLRLNAQALKHSAPFTGEYFCYLPRFFLAEKTHKSCCDGGKRRPVLARWELLENANKYMNGWIYLDSIEVSSTGTAAKDEQYSAYKVKKWISRSCVDGVVRQQGDLKMTYEVIQDHGCSSYALEKIPGYEIVIKGFKEGNFMVGALQRA